MEIGSNAAALIGIYAALCYDIIAAVCSSPQTTEINADKRAGTLMKWVNLGAVQAVGFTLLGAAAQQKEGLPIAPPLIGGGLGTALLYVQYVHARNSGLENGGPSTESY
jgi:hypothetical protein